MKRRFDRDRMNMAEPKEVAKVTLTVLDKLQDFRPEVAILGAAAVFLELSAYLGVPPQEAFSATNNLINHDDGKRPEFAAVSSFMHGEWEANGK